MNPRRPVIWRLLAVLLALTLIATACGDDTDTSAADESATTVAEEMADSEDAPTDESAGVMIPDPELSVRESGLTVRVYELDGVTLHTLTAPVEVFANTTYVLEGENSLVLVDTQFLLPNALDMRAYADSLGKPIDRMYITHEHPDHFLGSEAFADVPIFALTEVAERIAEIGDAEVAEKQADFGPEAIAGSFVSPEPIEPGTVEIDGMTLELGRVVDAEAPVQLTIALPGTGAILVGDIVYSGVHLIMAGAPDTWTVALEDLQATADEYPLVLPGHGDPTDPSEYAVNIEWLATFAELSGTAGSADEFKQGLVDAFPGRPMESAIDFVLPFLFPAS